MNKQMEKMYISPLDFSGSDAAAIQAAVCEAIRTDIRTVVIPAKTNGEPWRVDETILLPNYVTVILDGCVLEGRCMLFANTNAYKADTKSLGGEEHDLFLVGKRGAKLIGMAGEPQVYLSIVKDFRIAGIEFKGGAGLKLHFARIGKVQQLKFEDSTYGIAMSEGCSGLLINDIDGVTEEETVLMQGGETTLYGRDPDIRKSILSRIRAKTNGAPAVGLYAGAVPMSCLIIRDVTDLTEGDGVSVRIGEAEQEVRDITVRGVNTVRLAVETAISCDGMHFANLSGGVVAREPNTRSGVDEAREDVVLPSFEGTGECDIFLTPNDPAFYAETDAQTIQNAVDAAAERGVALVIPRWNERAQSTVWNIEKAIQLPSNITVELWGCHLRQADFCYENIFCARDASNITITGSGDALLDGGIHNRLFEKNAGKYGFGPIEDNAMLRFINVDGLKLEGFRVKQSRWYAVYLLRCRHADVSNIDFASYALFCDEGGIYVRSGCKEVYIHELTGMVGDDGISITANASDPVESREDTIVQDVTIRNIKLYTQRGAMVRLNNQDGHCIRNVFVDAMLDVSLVEQKKSPLAGVFIGNLNGYYRCKAQPGELSGLRVRDMYTRATHPVTLSGYSAQVELENIHGFSTANDMGFVWVKAQADGLVMRDLYHRRDQVNGYLRGTANSIFTDKAKYIGMVLCLRNLTGDVTVNGAHAALVSGAVEVTGGAKVTVKDLDVVEYGKFFAACDSKSELAINGERVTPA